MCCKDDRNEIWIPDVNNELVTGDIIRWYNNIKHEIKTLSLPEELKKKYHEYYREAGLLNNIFKYRFFHHHYSRLLYIVIKHIINMVPNCRILDLGCGTGTQALLFALLGAEVVGIDLDKEALQILEIRRKYYESKIGKSLKVTSHCVDAFKTDFGLYKPFDVVYSLFAFNMMQPSGKLLDILCQHLNPGALLFIQDGNKNMWFNKLFRPRPVLSRSELKNVLVNRGFVNIEALGGYAIPPPLWQIFPNILLRKIDALLTLFPVLTVSYLHIAQFQEKIRGYSDA